MRAWAALGELRAILAEVVQELPEPADKSFVAEARSCRFVAVHALWNDVEVATNNRRSSARQPAVNSAYSTSQTSLSRTHWIFSLMGGLALSWGKPGILTSRQDRSVSCWQEHLDGALAKQFEVDPGETWAEHALWSKDGTRFVTAAGKKVRLWSRTGKLLQDYADQPSTLAALRLRPDGEAFGIGIYGGVSLYRTTEREPYEDLHWQGSIIEICWSPNSRFVAAASQERTINFWKLPFRPGEQLAMSG